MEVGKCSPTELQPVQVEGRGGGLVGRFGGCLWCPEGWGARKAGRKPLSTRHVHPRGFPSTVLPAAAPELSRWAQTCPLASRPSSPPAAASSVPASLPLPSAPVVPSGRHSPFPQRCLLPGLRPRLFLGIFFVLPRLGAPRPAPDCRLVSPWGLALVTAKPRTSAWSQALHAGPRQEGAAHAHMWKENTVVCHSTASSGGWS